MTNPTTSRIGASRSNRLLALGAVAGPVLFSLAWLVLGILSPGYTLFGHRFTDYSPVSQPISGLGMGSTGPYMNTAFVLTGLILVAGVIGVFRVLPPERPALRRWSLALLACTGIGQVLCGIFNLEAMMLHNLGVGLAIGTPVVAFLVAGAYLRGLPDWRRFGTRLLLGSPLTLALLITFFADVPADHRRRRAWHRRARAATARPTGTRMVRRDGLARIPPRRTTAGPGVPPPRYPAGITGAHDVDTAVRAAAEARDWDACGVVAAAAPPSLVGVLRDPGHAVAVAS
jgi:hypothetical membrane protein